jgi:hypothetical protein
MADITPLARGPLSAFEAAVLDAIPITNGTPESLTAVTGLDPLQVEVALAQLTRRGLVHRNAGRVRVAERPTTRRHLRLLHGTATTPTPTMPAA